MELTKKNHPLSWQRRQMSLWPWLFLMVAFLLMCTTKTNAQSGNEYDEAEEIGVFLMIQGIGGYEMDVVYANDKVYVPVSQFFQILKVNHYESANSDSISGFYLNENQKYLISRADQKIVLGNTVTQTDASAFFTGSSGLYLRSDYIGNIFGLNLNFNFRSLSLELKTMLELPVIKELRLEQMRKNISTLRGETTVDSTIKREYHVFRGGNVDWSIISSQVSGKKSDLRAGLAMGAELLGGETNVMLNYSSQAGFDDRQQLYKWRWANNDAQIVRQISIGKVQTKAISSIYAPLLGISATNTPTTFRKSFGSYELTDYTEPGWTVELYINNVIVDYTTADASGFFRFEVPMVYGTSEVSLKFYGPWGEERTRQQTVNIPYNFLPKGVAEYSVTTAMVQDTLHSRFARAEGFWGLHRSVTVGAGYEYFSAIQSGPGIPFVNASARFLNYFMFSGEMAYGVRSRGTLNFRMPSNLSVDLEYSKYTPGQKAISYNYREERKASLSIPIKAGSFKSFARMSFKQNVLSELNYSSAEFLWSGYFNGISTNISGFANWISKGNPYFYSNLALGFRLGRNLNLRPQAQIDITNKKLISLKTELEQTVNKWMHLSLVYEENLRQSLRSVEIACRFDLPFAQTGWSARLTNEILSTTEGAHGSLVMGSGNGYIYTNNRSNVGRGGLTIIPFLDINNNGKRDKNEPMASNLNIRINGGHLIEQKSDSLIRVNELEQYASYLIELDDNSFDNIAWQLEKKSFKVEIDPNQFKQINVPIKVLGEVNGWINMRHGNSETGQGRIIINISDSSGKIIQRSMSEMDGYYNYLGLAPGHYTASVDKTQLSRLNLGSKPEMAAFDIAAMEAGDIVDDISFTLFPLQPIEPPIKPEQTQQGTEAPKDKPAPAKINKNQPEETKVPAPASENDKPTNSLDELNKARQTSRSKQLEVKVFNSETIQLVEGNLNIKSGPYMVQTGAFANRDNASRLLNDIQSKVNYTCGIILENGLYKVRFGYFTEASKAVECGAKLSNMGYLIYLGVLSE